MILRHYAITLRHTIGCYGAIDIAADIIIFSYADITRHGLWPHNITTCRATRVRHDTHTYAATRRAITTATHSAVIAQDNR